MLDIKLLGSPQVTVDGNDIVVDTRKAIALLAYLAVERSAERDILAALFWADSSPERARATLRRTLSALKGAVGTGAIEADRQRVELKDHFTSDVRQFDEAIAETASHDHEANDVCDLCVSPLSRAASLYRADFLGAFAVRDAPEFEDWARPVTESLRLKAGGVYQRLAMAQAGTGDYSAAIATGSEWIALDDLHEPAHRLLMLLNAWAGDRPGAMQAYRDCVAILDRELGVPPLEETTELFEAILDEDLPPAPGVRRAVKSVKAPASDMFNEMLDRSEAVARLHAELNQARGRSRLCLITGDSWMGKTRLVEHLSALASSSGFLVVSARAFRAESKLPYGVATALLSHLTALVNQANLELPVWALDELSRLDPRLSPGPVSHGAERLGQLRLSEAYLTVLESVAASTPLVVSIDDAQWMDSASAALLAYVQRRVDEAPILFVITTRDRESMHPSFRELASGSTSIVELGPLTVDDLDVNHPDLDLDLDQIVDSTGGIPLLVKEALDTGSIAPDSVSVVRYMDSRRRRLSDLAKQVMAAAAVLDGMCDAQLLRDTSGRTDDEVVDAVEDLVTAGLLREEPDGRLGFTLDVLETMTYESTSLIRRRLLHRRAAEAITSRSRSQTDARLATAVAGHMRAAGMDGAADWYRLAGDLSRDVFANDEAVSAYETAIALGYPQVAELHLSLGELAMTRGDYQTATRELRTAASRSKGATLALVEHRLGDVHRIMGRFELAEENFTRARVDHPSPADLFAGWALLRHRVGDQEEARNLATDAVRAAEDSGDEEMLARALNILGVVTADHELAIAHVDKALALAGSSDPGRIAALNTKAHLLADVGDLDAAAPLVSEAIELADRAGHRHHKAALLNHLADLHHHSGRTEQAETALTEAVTLFADLIAGDWEPEVWLLREW